MKKLLIIFITVVLCLSVCSCKKEDNKVELTLANYDKYLNVSPYAYVNSRYPRTMEYGATVTGTTSNFNYYDIQIVVKITGSYALYSKIGSKVFVEDRLDLYKTITVDQFDIAGNGEASDSFSEKYPISDSFVPHFEVISVKGYVIPA